jgi:hypothetical protein
LKTNTVAKDGYYATPNVGAVPPMSSMKIKVCTAEMGYTSLLARSDRFVVVGVGMPKYLNNRVLKNYLKVNYYRCYYYNTCHVVLVYYEGNVYRAS